MHEILTTYYLLAFSFLTFLNIRYGIFFVLVSLPSYLVRFELLGIPTTLLEIQIYLLFAFWLFEKKKQFSSPFLLSSMLWISASVIAIVVSPDQHAALGLFKAYFIDPFLFFLVINSVLQKRDLPFIFQAFFLLAFSIFCVTFLQVVNVLPSLSPWIHEVPKRVTGLFEYPNAIGLLLTPIAVLSFVFYLSKTPLLSRILLLSTFFVSTFAILFSWSRGGLLTIFLCILLYLVVQKKFRYALGIFSLTIFLIMGTPVLKQNASNVLSFSDTSTDVRLALWQGTWNLLSHHPITGAGLSGFPIMYEQYKLAKHTELLQYPHNIFLDIWSELGMVGLSVFIYILIVFFCNTVKYKDTFLFIFPILAILTYGLVDSPIFKNDLIILFWVYLSLPGIFQKKNSIDS